MPGHGTFRRVARHLGPHMHYRGASSAERSQRLRACRIGFALLGQFWGSDTPLRFKTVVFKANVYNAALSGLEAWAMGKGDLDALDRTLIWLMRKFFRVRHARGPEMAKRPGTATSRTRRHEGGCSVLLSGWSSECEDCDGTRRWSLSQRTTQPCLQCCSGTCGPLGASPRSILMGHLGSMRILGGVRCWRTSRFSKCTTTWLAFLSSWRVDHSGCFQMGKSARLPLHAMSAFSGLHATQLQSPHPDAQHTQQRGASRLGGGRRFRLRRKIVRWSCVWRQVQEPSGPQDPPGAEHWGDTGTAQCAENVRGHKPVPHSPCDLCDESDCTSTCSACCGAGQVCWEGQCDCAHSGAATDSLASCVRPGV